MSPFLRALAWVLFSLFLIAAIVEFIRRLHDGTSSDFEAVLTGWIILGVGALIWFILDIWAERRETRPCPRCGRRVPNGAMVCPTCKYEFSAVATSLSPSSAPPT